MGQHGKGRGQKGKGEERRQRGNGRKIGHTNQRKNKGKTNGRETLRNCTFTKTNNRNNRLKLPNNNRLNNTKERTSYRGNKAQGKGQEKKTKTRSRQNSRIPIQLCDDTIDSVEGKYLKIFFLFQSSCQ